MRNRCTPILLATGRWGAVDEAATHGVLVSVSQRIPVQHRWRVAEQLTIVGPHPWMGEWACGHPTRDSEAKRCGSDLLHRRYAAYLEQHAQTVEREVHALAMKHRGDRLVLMGYETAPTGPAFRRWFAEWWMARNPDDEILEVCDVELARQLRLQVATA